MCCTLLLLLLFFLLLLLLLLWLLWCYSKRLLDKASPLARCSRCQSINHEPRENSQPSRLVIWASADDDGDVALVKCNGFVMMQHLSCRRWLMRQHTRKCQLGISHQQQLLQRHLQHLQHHQHHLDYGNFQSHLSVAARSSFHVCCPSLFEINFQFKWCPRGENEVHYSIIIEHNLIEFCVIKINW